LLELADPIQTSFHDTARICITTTAMSGKRVVCIAHSNGGTAMKTVFSTLVALSLLAINVTPVSAADARTSPPRDAGLASPL
jgi:hypothetical protein